MGISGYYFITDSALSRAGNASDVRSAVAAGVRAVQYREKALDTKKMYEEALALRKICKGALLIINDRVDVALAAGADGVHIGREDSSYRLARRLLGKDKIIGVTAHNIEEAKEAERLGADYIGLSPIFKTSTKKDAGRPAGLSLIREVRSSVSIPIIAIGGINLSNAEEAIAAGADGLSAISAVVTKPDARKEMQRFQSLFN